MNASIFLNFLLSILAARHLRLVFRLALPTTALAVALGRSAGPPPAPLAVPDRPPLVVEPSRADYARGQGDAARRFLDPSTGLAFPITRPVGVPPRRLGWSPRRVGGGAQALATWREPPLGDSFLIRFSVADGVPLARVPLLDLPNWWGDPCWFPDGSPRALLAGVDGLLHRVEFAAPDRSPPPRPRSLPWPEGPDLDRPAQLGDLHWPSDPRLGGRLLASARPVPTAGDGWSLRWLRLDDGAGAIVASGRLAKPAAGDFDQRHPVVGLDPRGRPSVAYLDGRGDMPGHPWRLRVAPIDFDAATGDPSLDPASTTTLAEDASPTPPAFVPESGELAYVPSYERATSACVRRIALPVGPRP